MSRADDDTRSPDRAQTGTDIEPEPTEGLLEIARFRVIQWSKILSAYFSAMSAAQLLGIGAGLLFINFMPVREFALYTLAFSVVTFFHFLTDLGSTSSLVYFRRRALREGESFDGYVEAVLSLRRALFALGAVAVLVGLPLTARAKGFALGPAVLASVAVTLTVWFQLVSTIRVLELRLRDRYARSYRAEIAGGAARLTLAGVLVLTGLLRAWLGVLAAAAASAATAWVARARRGGGSTERPPPENEQIVDRRLYRRRIVRYLLPTLPSALYFSIQSPLVVWLATAFAGTENIAEVGALGRLGMVVGLFSSLTSIVFIPRLAQVTDDRIYLRRYFQFGGFLAVVGLGLVAAAWLFPGLFLFVLGPNYSGLRWELLLTVAGSAVGLLGGYFVAVNLARSWNRWQGAAVAVMVASQGVMVAVLPLGTTAGVLTFNLLTAVVGLMLQLGVNAIGFTKSHWVHWE